MRKLWMMVLMSVMTSMGVGSLEEVNFQNRYIDENHNGYCDHQEKGDCLENCGFVDVDKDGICDRYDADKIHDLCRHKGKQCMRKGYEKRTRSKFSN